MHQLLIEQRVGGRRGTAMGDAVSAIDASTVKASGRTVRCRWMLGADGKNSRVTEMGRDRTGVEQRDRVGAASALSRHTVDDFVEVHWRDRCQAYITPVGPNEICIALIGSRARLAFRGLDDDVSRTWPEACRCDTDRLDARAISVSTRLRRVIRGRLALIGDDFRIRSTRSPEKALRWRSGRQRFWPRVVERRPHDIHRRTTQRISRMPG